MPLFFAGSTDFVKTLFYLEPVVFSWTHWWLEMWHEAPPPAEITGGWKSQQQPARAISGYACKIAKCEEPVEKGWDVAFVVAQTIFSHMIWWWFIFLHVVCLDFKATSSQMYLLNSYMLCTCYMLGCFVLTDCPH